MPASRVSPQDPAAALAFAVVTVLGIFGVAQRYSITADMVLTLIGAAMTIAATVRTWRDAKKAPVVATIAVEQSMQPELGPKFVAAVAEALERRAAEDSERLAVPKGSTEATTKRLTDDVPPEDAVDG
jgi:hypothetical protein